MTLFSERRAEQVLIQINGKPAPKFERSRVGFRFVDRIYKRDSATLELADPVREFRDELLVADDFYLVSWGYPGNMSRPRGLKLKDWRTSMNDRIGTVILDLQVTSAHPISKSKKAQVPSEPHKTRISRNWGRITTTAIAKKIARRHGLDFRGDNSDDKDRTPYVQPMNVSDYGYIRRLAENIDFEFFIEAGTLYYRKKPYDENPRRTFVYLPNQRDNLLLSFTPTVKVTTVRTKPNSVDVEQGEHPWSDVTRAAVDLADSLFKGDKTEIEQAINLLSDQTDEAFQNADRLRKVFTEDPTAGNEQSRQEANQILTELIQELAVSKRESRDTQKQVDKQGRANRTKVVGANDRGRGNCSKKEQLPGVEPTGQSKSTEALEIKVRTRGSSIVSRELADRLGIAESVVRTTDSTPKQRGKKACASHGKKVDKAVTATAEFVGDPSLRAKVNYNFENVGRLFNGKWYAEESAHDLPVGKYTVSMNLKRGTLNKRGGGKKGKKGKKKGQTASQTNRGELVNKITVRNGEESIERLPPSVANK